MVFYYESALYCFGRSFDCADIYHRSAEGSCLSITNPREMIFGRFLTFTTASLFRGHKTVMIKPRTWLFIFFVFGLSFIYCDFNDHTPYDEVFLAQHLHHNNIIIDNHITSPHFIHIISSISVFLPLLLLDLPPPV